MKAYVTFGQVHVHRIGDQVFDKDCVAVIEAPDYISCRELSFKLFGGKWHNCYPEEEWSESQMMYFPRGYMEVTV